MAVALAADTGAFFVPPQALPSRADHVAHTQRAEPVSHRCHAAVQQRRTGHRRQRGLTMYVEPKGSDAFEAIEAEAEQGTLKKVLKRMGPGAASAVTTGLIPAAAAIGFLATPGGAALSTIGAVVSGLAGGVCVCSLRTLFSCARAYDQIL